MFRIPVIALLFCSILSLSYAQDSVKKKKPLKPLIAVPVKPIYPKYKSYKPHPYKYRTKADSIAAKQAILQKAAARKDTVAPAPIVLDKSLNGQYQYLLTKVYRYQQPLITTLWKSASDTIAITHRKLRDVQSKLAIQNKAMDSLTAQLKNKDQTLSTTSEKVDTIDVLGITVAKGTYNLVVWGLVLLFGLTALIVIIRSGSYSREAKYRIKLYAELEEEFRVYKTKAIDKEKKLARELQTERNKLDELLGR